MRIRPKMLDTPLLREEYKKFRKSVTQMIGGSSKKFDDIIKMELESQKLEPTPRNYVACAASLEQEVYEFYYEESVAAQNENQYEAAMEQKYDFLKENQ